MLRRIKEGKSEDELKNESTKKEDRLREKSRNFRPRQSAWPFTGAVHVLQLGQSLYSACLSYKGP